MGYSGVRPSEASLSGAGGSSYDVLGGDVFGAPRRISQEDVRRLHPREGSTHSSRDGIREGGSFAGGAGGMGGLSAAEAAAARSRLMSVEM